MAQHMNLVPDLAGCPFNAVETAGGASVSPRGSRMARTPLDLANALCLASERATVAWPSSGRANLRNSRGVAVIQPGSNRGCDQGQKI